MEPFNLALIGSRGHWQQTLREIEQIQEIRIVALADGGDTAAPLADWARAKGHSPSVHADHREMLNHVKPDAVVVMGPWELHAQMCIDALDRRVHVLTEKCAALTMRQLNDLRAASAQRPDIHLAALMFSRYTAGFATARKLIEAGAVGKVRIINTRKSYKLGQRPAYYRERATYGGTIPWIGSHAIDWIYWLGGGVKFKSVFATHTTKDNGGNGTMESAATCDFVLDDDRFATASIDYLRPEHAPTHGDDWARVVGSEGVLEVRPESVTSINRENDGSKPVGAKSDRTLLRDFVDHVRGKTKSSLNAAATLAVTEACLLARQSADEHRVAEFGD